MTEVTQADREVALAIALLARALQPGDWRHAEVCADYRSGRRDGWASVQLIARHRQQSTAEALAGQRAAVLAVLRLAQVEEDLFAAIAAATHAPTAAISTASADEGAGEVKFQIGDFVEKVSGSSWRGTVVGTYSTTLTPEGYAVESATETGSVQIYPAKALQIATPQPTAGDAVREADVVTLRECAADLLAAYDAGPHVAYRRDLWDCLRGILGADRHPYPLPGEEWAREFLHEQRSSGQDDRIWSEHQCIRAILAALAKQGEGL